MGGFSGNESSSSSGDAKTDLGGMRGADGNNNQYGDRNGGFSQNGTSSSSVSVSDRSSDWDGQINDIGSTEEDLAQSRAELAAAGISRDQNPSLGSLASAHNELGLAKSDLSEKVAGAYGVFGLDGLPGQVKDTMVGDLGLADDLRGSINSEDRAELSRDLASRTSNGTLGTLAGLTGIAGSLVNAGIDTKQANSISNRAFGVDPGFTESLGTFARSGIRNAAGSTIGAQVGQVVGGALAGTLGPSTAGLLGMAASKTASGLINNPNTYSTAAVPGPASTSTITQGDGGQGLGPTANPAENNTSAGEVNTGYASSFGDYDSHLTGFDYANLALKSWS
jgi:hypothetical protein